MRLLLPQLDKERQTYGLKETMLGKYYVEVLNIAQNSEDATRLLNWRKPTRTATGNVVCAWSCALFLGSRKEVTLEQLCSWASKTDAHKREIALLET